MLQFHQVPLDPEQIDLLQTSFEDDSYDYPMIPEPPKQAQHVPSIDKCELNVLTGHKVPQHEVNNVTSVLKSSKPYFAWDIKQSVAANTPLSATGLP